MLATLPSPAQLQQLFWLPLDLQVEVDDVTMADGSRVALDKSANQEAGLPEAQSRSPSATVTRETLCTLQPACWATVAEAAARWELEVPEEWVQTLVDASLAAMQLSLRLLQHEVAVQEGQGPAAEVQAAAEVCRLRACTGWSPGCWVESWVLGWLNVCHVKARSLE
jgi:hypothetical protein